MPDYLIFYEEHNTNDLVETHVNIKIYYRKILPLIFLMGPVFRIDSFQNTYLICIPCQEIDIFFELFGEIFEVANIWKTIYADINSKTSSKPNYSKFNTK